MSAKRSLDPRLASLLDSLRQRVRRYVVWDSVLAILAVVLVAFWVGLALDYLPVQLGGTEMPRLARTLLLLIVGAAVLAIVVRMLAGRLRRPLPDDSLALLVERHHPSLGGRLVTAVQLNEPGRDGDSHSPKLLSEVHSQAAAAIDEVDPNRVFRWEPLVRKALIAGPLALGVLILLVASPQSFARAASRLTLLSDEPWPRRAELQMVGVELPEGPQPLLRVCTALLQAELNILQAYPLIVRPHGKPAVAIMVENIELAMETLVDKGFTIITEGDLDDNPTVDQ